MRVRIYRMIKSREEKERERSWQCGYAYNTPCARGSFACAKYDGRNKFRAGCPSLSLRGEGWGDERMAKE